MRRGRGSNRDSGPSSRTRTGHKLLRVSGETRVRPRTSTRRFRSRTRNVPQPARKSFTIPLVFPSNTNSRIRTGVFRDTTHCIVQLSSQIGESRFSYACQPRPRIPVSTYPPVAATSVPGSCTTHCVPRPSMGLNSTLGTSRQVP